MKTIIENTNEILENCIGPFRRYLLVPSVETTFVSRSLCDMLGCTTESLLRDGSDSFASFLHPADRNIYEELLQHLLQNEQTLTVQYRLFTADGKVRYVNDTATSQRETDGTLVGYSVLTDVTALVKQNHQLYFLNETVPCGMLCYSCEKQPKLRYVNDQMLRILRFPFIKDGEMDYLELCRDNIFLMIPMEERRKFSHFLHQVQIKGVPIAGEMTVLRCDGTKARLYGWVTKVTSETGEEEFQSVCMDVTERYYTKQASQTERYLRALSDVYDLIFEYDFANQTVKFLHGKNSDSYSKIKNIPMHLKEATEQWIQHNVCREDRTRVFLFITEMFARAKESEYSRPPQIQFRVLSIDDGYQEKLMCGIFLKIDSAVSLFCCRAVIDEKETRDLREENLSLKNMNENMQEVVMRFTEGVAAFEVTADRVTPLYVSENVCEFFGFTKDEWFSRMKQSSSIREFVSHSGVGYEKFSELLSCGEAEFSYFDIQRGVQRQIKAICSQKHADGSASRYVMLYHLDRKKEKDAESDVEHPNVYIRTFGYFDVFVDGKPIAFRNKKAKELFALLVDRRGGYVSSEEAISFLWENEPISAVTLSRYRKEALRLKNTLEEHGISDVLESVDGKRRVVPERFDCDLYDYLSRKEEYAQLFKGSYLTNYSWGEVTLGELLNENPI